LFNAAFIKQLACVIVSTCQSSTEGVLSCTAEYDRTDCTR